MLDCFDSADTGTLTPSIWTVSGSVTVVSPGRTLPGGVRGGFAAYSCNNTTPTLSKYLTVNQQTGVPYLASEIWFGAAVKNVRQGNAFRMSVLMDNVEVAAATVDSTGRPAVFFGGVYHYGAINAVGNAYTELMLHVDLSSAGIVTLLSGNRVVATWSGNTGTTSPTVNRVLIGQSDGVELDDIIAAIPSLLFSSTSGPDPVLGDTVMDIAPGKTGRLVVSDYDSVSGRLLCRGRYGNAFTDSDALSGSGGWSASAVVGAATARQGFIWGLEPFSTFPGDVRSLGGSAARPVSDGATQFNHATPTGTNFGNAANVPPNPAQNNYSFFGNATDNLTIGSPTQGGDAVVAMCVYGTARDIGFGGPSQMSLGWTSHLGTEMGPASPVPTSSYEVRTAVFSYLANGDVISALVDVNGSEIVISMVH